MLALTHSHSLFLMILIIYMFKISALTQISVMLFNLCPSFCLSALWGTHFLPTYFLICYFVICRQVLFSIIIAFISGYFTRICLYSWITSWHSQPCNLITWQFNYIIFKSWHIWIYHGFVSIVHYGTYFLVNSYLFLFVSLFVGLLGF